MSIEEGPKSPPQDIDTKSKAEVVDIAQARERMGKKVRPENSEQREPSPDFQAEKRDFLERTRESLNTARKRTENQRAEMQARQDAIDRKRILLDGLTREGKATQEKSYTNGNQNIDNAFAIMERNLELAEQIDSPDLFRKVRQSFEESLSVIEQGLAEQEKVLGRVPQKELKEMPESVQREILQQQQIAETFPDDLLGKLDSFRQRINLIKGIISPDVLKKVENAIFDTETIVSGLKLIPGLKRLDHKSSLEKTMAKIDQAILGGEEQAKKRS